MQQQQEPAAVDEEQQVAGSRAKEQAAPADTAAAATIHDLPDVLLSAVLARLGSRYSAAAALLVSKRWHRVFLSEPVLWRGYTLDTLGSGCASELALLRRVGGLLAWIELMDEGGPGVNRPAVQAAVMGALQPQRLQDLAAEYPTPQLLAALPRFSRLSRLELGTYYRKLPAGTGAALQQLQQLHSLSLACSSKLPAGTAAALRQLVQLRSLSLNVEKLQQGAVDAILACTQLTELSLERVTFEQRGALLQLTQLSQLASLALQARGIQLPEPALLPGLTTFKCEVHTPLQVAGCEVGSCSYTAGSCGTAQLKVDAVEPANSLPRVLDALHPGGALAALQRLELSDCELDEAALARCSSRLAAVTHLQLRQCQPAVDSSWEAAFPVLLRSAPLLASLEVYSCLRGEVPQSLVAHTGLWRLALVQNGLDMLPAGPYLAGLARFRLDEKTLRELPPALTAATALTCLKVSCMRPWAGPMAVDSLLPVLGQLPQLRHLQLSNCDLKTLPASGWPGISALQSLDLGINQLASLPAALSLAVSLRQLVLCMNPLFLTAQQLGALLPSLPLLEELNLSAIGLTGLPEHLPTGLRSLDLTSNNLQTLPSGLASATLLTRLDVWFNSDLRVTRADVDRVLAPLRHLRRMDLESGRDNPREVRQYAADRLNLHFEPRP